MKAVLSALACLMVFQAFGQERESVTIAGTVISAADSAALQGVNVVLLQGGVAAPLYGEATSLTGTFQIEAAARSTYVMRLSFVGYTTVERRLRIGTQDLDLGRIVMVESPVESDEVVVIGEQEPVMMRGDTTVFNADAYKVNPDADAEDLVRKLPGVTVEEGEVQAQGEAVRRVLLDGREFFGQDPTLALRNMPAEVVKEIEVYDRLSDQAQFTGFNDGNTEKTVNIVTRPGMRVGQFGRLHGGYGTESRYIGGGSVNIFDDERRISLIGFSNNVNQQNFASEDLLGVLNTASRRRGGGGGRLGDGRGRGRDQRGGGGAGGGRGGGFNRMSSNPSNFLVGQQPGVSTTSALGMNYSDQWGDKVQVSSSYFFNASGNTADVFLDREYVLADARSQLYNESNLSESDNRNHRFNMRMTYTIDERNSIIFTPRVSFQDNTSSSILSGVNSMPSGMLLSRTSNDYRSSNLGYTSSANLLFRHRLAKPGRTLSANLGLGFNDRWGDTKQQSASDFFDGRSLVPDSTLAYDQRIDSDTGGRSLSMVLSYTEPLGSIGLLEFSYRPSLSTNQSDRLANALDSAGTYSVLDTAFSNVFSNDVMRQSGGMSLRGRGAKLSGAIGFQVQSERLQGNATFPYALAVDRTFTNILPYAMANYRFARTSSLRLFYRTSTGTPSINQLQEVVDNTNPLQLTSGNPHLKPSYRYTLVARYNHARGGRTVMGMASVSRTDDYIGNATFFAQADTMLRPNVLLLQGAQFSQPENLGSQWNVRSFVTLGVPVWKTSLNLNGRFNYTRTPGIIDGESNTAIVQGLSGGAVLSSNISPRVDFTLSYSGTWSQIHNSLYPELDNNYVTHNAGARLYLMPLPRIVIDANLAMLMYQGLGDSFDQKSTLLNVGVGYKLLKDRSVEVKLMVADVLNQNSAVSRSVMDVYTEDSQTDTLGRYIMLNLSYRLRNFRI